VQGIFVLALIAVRPFEQAKNNVSKCVCEGSVMLLLCLMVVYKDADSWKGSTQNVFLLTMTASTGLL